jgi:hypothetical protein
VPTASAVGYLKANTIRPVPTSIATENHVLRLPHHDHPCFCKWGLLPGPPGDRNRFGRKKMEGQG